MKALNAIVALSCWISLSNVSALAQSRAETPKAYSIQQELVEDSGHPSIPVIIWSPNSGSHLGLIVISHGTGAGPAAHVDTAQALAEAGYVVVAAMHPGDNFQDDSDVGKPAWFVDRSRHVTKVIDYMLSRWAGHTRIASGRIGIFGFSAGGTTALISIGGIPNLDRVAPHCAEASEFVCSIMASQASPTNPEWTHDKRIAAAVIAAPGLGFTFQPSGLRKVRVPVQLWAGAADETVPYATNTSIVRSLLPAAPEFHSVEGAVHLSFLAPCTAQTPPFLCRDKPGFDRTKFHIDFNKTVVAFFQKQLSRK